MKPTRIQKLELTGIEVPIYPISTIWSWFAVIVTLRSKIHANSLHILNNQSLVEEYIHILQENELAPGNGKYWIQREIGWHTYIFLYCISWIWNIIRFKQDCYKNIWFEKEAKDNRENESYIINRPKNNWKKYIT